MTGIVRLKCGCLNERGGGRDGNIERVKHAREKCGEGEGGSSGAALNNGPSRVKGPFPAPPVVLKRRG